MGVGCRDDVGAGLVDLTVDGEGSSIERPFTLDDVALMVDADEVADRYQLEVLAEWVDPEAIEEFRIAGP